jgi:hypothetical protein
MSLKTVSMLSPLGEDMFLKGNIFNYCIHGGKNMHTTSLLKKGLAVGIIFLFIGIAVAPSISSTVVKASNDNNLIEVTSQACGIKGFGDTIVRLTKEQYRDLEQYLVDFRARLNQTTTREEAVPLFKDAVVELNKYGLLPHGMSVAQAQKLVIGIEPSEKTQEFIKKFLKRNQSGAPNNTLCLLAGNVDEAWFWSLLTFSSLAAFGFLVFLYFFLQYYFGFQAWELFAIAAFIPMVLFIYGLFVKPINILSIINFIPSATGSIYSVGLSGVYKVNGTFEGDIVGFTGIRIMKLVHLTGAFFLGSALSISLQSKD